MKAKFKLRKPIMSDGQKCYVWECTYGHTSYYGSPIVPGSTFTLNAWAFWAST